MIWPDLHFKRLFWLQNKECIEREKGRNGKETTADISMIEDGSLDQDGAGADRKKWLDSKDIYEVKQSFLLIGWK